MTNSVPFAGRISEDWTSLSKIVIFAWNECTLKAQFQKTKSSTTFKHPQCRYVNTRFEESYNSSVSNFDVNKLLFLSYFKGKALASYHDLSIRRVKLLQSRTCFQQYLDICADFKLLHETEMRKVDKEHVRQRIMIILHDMIYLLLISR